MPVWSVRIGKYFPRSQKETEGNISLYGPTKPANNLYILHNFQYLTVQVHYIMNSFITTTSLAEKKKLTVTQESRHGIEEKQDQNLEGNRLFQERGKTFIVLYRHYKQKQCLSKRSNLPSG